MTEPMTPSAVEKLLRSAGSDRDWLLFCCLYYAAMTPEEVYDLLWSDMSRRGGQFFVTLRGRGGARLPLPEALTETVQRLHAGHRRDEPVFVSRLGGPLSKRHVHRMVDAAGLRARLKDVSPRSLRYAHAVHAIERGATLRDIVGTMGVQPKAVMKYFESVAMKRKPRPTYEMLPELKLTRRGA